MPSLSKKAILQKIENQEPVEGVLDDGSLYIKVLSYVPYISTAIHDGHGFREELEHICLLNESERYHEEDPYTGDFIKDCPIQLIALDSRFEYDLNRNPNDCIHTVAWGNQVWKRELTSNEREESLRKFNQFYEILYALIERLTPLHKTTFVFDVHSYNVLDREYKAPPLFNIGTHFVDMKRYAPFVNEWISQLAQLTVPNVSVEAKENAVYFGKGYVAESIRQKYPHCLVLPTEVKKIYADENKPIRHEAVIAAIRQGFHPAIMNTLKRAQD